MKVAGIAEIDVTMDELIDVFDAMSYADQFEFFDRMGRRLNSTTYWSKCLGEQARNTSEGFLLFQTLGRIAGLVDPEVSCG